MFRSVYYILIIFILSFASATTFASEDGSYTLLPGDVIQISVWKEEGMDQELVILPDGTITFPLIGTVHVSGKKPSELQSLIREKLNALIPDAAVTVIVKAPLGHKVSVIGQVQVPGEVLLTSNISVIQALSQVGGLTPYADEDEIIIIRKNIDGSKEIIKFSFADISKGKNLDKDIDLLPGDTIVVPASSLF